MGKIVVSSREEVDKYFASERLNQSKLKNLASSYGYFMSQIDKYSEKEVGYEKGYFLLGGAVDVILTGNEGDFEKEYHVSKLLKRPSETISNIVYSVYKDIPLEVVVDTEFDQYREAILAACREFGYQKNWKEDTRVNKVIIEGENYFNDLRLAGDKKVISVEMYENISKIVKSLRENRRTEKYFNRTMQEHFSEDITFYYQLPLYFDYEGVECKGLMDLVVVVRDSEGVITSILPVDLKTMSGPVLMFKTSLKKHRYDIQAAWYREGVAKHFGVEKSVVENFQFVVESSTSPGNPLVFSLSDFTLDHGKFGSAKSFVPMKSLEEDSLFQKSLVYEKTHGFHTLIELYKYYEKQGWEQDKVLDENPEVLKLDWNHGIIPDEKWS